MSTPIALFIANRAPGATSLYTEAALRREARSLAGRDAITSLHVSVSDSRHPVVQLVVEHRNRAGAVTVSRAAL
jgi:hypothetical protein